MDDFGAARARVRGERSSSPPATGDPVLMADAHYDLGFLSMVAHQEAISSGSTSSGRSTCTAPRATRTAQIRARQALVPGHVPGR